MQGRSTTHIVALRGLPRPFRLTALWAISLLLIPQSSAQDTNVSYDKGDWSPIPLGGEIRHVSTSSNARATFYVDGDIYSTINIAAGGIKFIGSGPVGLYDANNVFLDNINDALTYNIPSEKRGVQQYAIHRLSGSNNLVAIYVDSVTPVPRAQTSDTQTRSPTGAVTQVSTALPNAPSLPSIVSTSTSAIPSSSQSITPSNNSSTSATTSLLGQITAFPTGLDSPPPNTNAASSISNTSFASDNSNSSGPSSSTIIGTVFGVLVCLTLCIFAALLYRRRRTRKRVAPSTAFMNFRSTTEQPPEYPFSRTSFFRRSVSGLGMGDSKMSSPHRYAPGIGGLGYGATATAGAGGRRLTTLDEKSAEGGESMQTLSAISPSYEDPNRLVVPSPAHGMGFGRAAGTSVSVGGIYGSEASPRGPSIDGGVARTLTPPPSTTSSNFASTPSLMDQNPYDGIVDSEPELITDPFKTPPATDNMAGRGAWGRV